MARLVLYLFIIATTVISCKQEPTLQTYFVENQDKKDFMVVDVSSDILNLEKNTLTPQQEKVLKSFDKLNVLAFKPDFKNKENQAKYEAEKQKITTILKDKKYQELIKVGSGKNQMQLSFTGDENAIDEFILYGNQKETGFAVVRILGNDMKPENALEFISILQNSNLNLEELKGLQEFIKK